MAETLASPAVADDEGAEKNGAGSNSMFSTVITSKSANGGVSGEDAKFTVGDSYLEHDKIIDKAEHGNGSGGTRNGEETSDRVKGNIVSRAQAVEELFESLNLDFLGKNAENVVGGAYRSDDGDKGRAIETQVFGESFRSSNENGRSELSENGLDKEADEKGNSFGEDYTQAKVTVADSYLECDKMIDKTENCNGFGGTQNAGETGEGFNGNTIQCSGDGRVVIGAQVVDKLFESSNEENSGKDAENVVGEDYKGNDKIEDKAENANCFGATQQVGETKEGFNVNIIQCSHDKRVLVRAQAVEKLFGSPNGKFLSKEAENVIWEDFRPDDEYAKVTGDGSYLEHDRTIDKTEEGNRFAGTRNRGEACVGLNGNIIQLSGDGRLMTRVEAVTKLFESSNGEFFGKDAENVVEEDYRYDDDGDEKGLVIKTHESFRSSNGNGRSEFTENGVDENGISLVVEIFNVNRVGKCDGVELEKVGKEDESKDREHVLYAVGDFVWSKFNSHPWWPAQIYDPSDASDHAKKCSHRVKQLLVAYFGDGSFSWRSPSQLKPFAENFDELSKQSDSIAFLTAVQCALDEIGRVADLKMTCPCVSEANKAGLIRRAMVNVGIKEGVVGTECDFSRLPVSDFEPAELLSKLRSVAVANPIKSVLELIGLRSCLSAFYRFNGGRKLTLYHEGVGIEGLEDKTINASDQPRLQKFVGFFANKLRGTQKRKRRSVALLMKESAAVEPSSNKKMKSIDKFPLSPMKKVSSSESDVEEGHEEALDDNEDRVLDGETGDMTASRKRKKSRYLSYPYTGLNLSVDIFGSKRDLEAESVKISKIARIGEKMIKTAAKFSQSSPIVKKKLKGKSENGGDSSATLGPQPQREDRNKMIEPVKIEASPEEVVTLAHYAALNPQKSWGSDTCDTVNDFISAYRSVVYKKGSNYKPLGKKRKSLSSKPVLGVTEQNENQDEMITITEMKRGTKKKNSMENKTVDEVKDNEGLLFVKQKLRKMTSMVEKCDGDMSSEMKLSLETEMRGLLEKIRAMANTVSS